MSIIQIIKKDHRCFWLLFFLIAWWITTSILGVFQYARPSGDLSERSLIIIFGLISLAITASILAYVSIRVRHVSKALNSGVEVTGHVTQNGPNSEDVWSVEFEYFYQGERFKGKQTMGGSSSSQKFGKGKDVVLLIDPKNPGRSIIKDIYVD
jgi:hypothetical protein